MVIRAQDAIHHGIAHVQVRRRHVDFGAENARAILKFAFAHALEQVEIFLCTAVAIGAFFAGLGERSAVFANFVGAQVVNVGLAVID